MAGGVFGFDKAIEDLEMKEKGAEKARKLVGEYADKMKDRAKSIAVSRGLYDTGKGVEGIRVEMQSEDIANVGWGARPNLHLWFHEVGYTQKGVYHPPRPHMRPAHGELEGKFIDEVNKAVEGE